MNALQVKVTDDLTLDAGRWETVRADEGWVRQVYPPETTMYQQLIVFLSALPPWPGDRPLRIGEEAIAATAVCLRWGTYLAVLMDPGKPLWPESGGGATSRVSDGEMARINVEASAALADWLALMRDDWEGYLALMQRAYDVLPMTRKSVPTDRTWPFAVLAAQNEVTEMLTTSSGAGVLERRRAEVEARPMRALANVFINACWRNAGPIEAIHSGSLVPLPLTQRRITLREERTLMRTSAGHLANAILATFTMACAREKRGWAECVLPFTLVPAIAPWGWSMDEATRQVCLMGTEPPIRHSE